MTYPEVVQYLDSFTNYEDISQYPYKESIKLEKIKDFLSIIGNPQDDLKCIHIAGSKGKGSTCVFISYILKEAGYRVGLYTSPHLSDFRERIRILNSELSTKPSPRGLRSEGLGSEGSSGLNEFEGMIAQQEIVNMVEKLRESIDKFNTNSKYAPLTFFEVYTALAFLYFKQKQVDFAVLETGLGGRLDATNTVDSIVSVITPVSYEHTHMLGNTLAEIAREKIGIIRRQKLSVITAPQEEEVREVVRARCVEMGTRLFEVGKDIIFKKTSNGFSIKGILGEYPDLEIQLLGDHQLMNAATAVGAVEALHSYGINIGIDSIRGGVRSTVWPGRCEVISRDPLIVLDGAQNVASAKTLKETIKENFPGGKYNRLILVLGISSDKDIKGICQELSEICDEIILTKSGNPRAANPEDIILQLIAYNLQVKTTSDLKEALELAKSRATSEDLILVTGSLFLVGEIREIILQEKGKSAI